MENNGQKMAEFSTPDNILGFTQLKMPRQFRRGMIMCFQLHACKHAGQSTHKPFFNNFSFAE